MPMALTGMTALSVLRQTTLAHPMGDRRVDDVGTADHVRAHRLEGEELARGHLLESGSVEDPADTGHCIVDQFAVAHIADVEPHIGPTEGGAHGILLLLVPAEHANLAIVLRQQMADHGPAERPRAARNQNRFVDGHIEFTFPSLPL